MTTALIGNGYWGSKLVKYFRENSFFELKYIYDSKSKLELDNVQVAVIATPIDTHYKMIKKALLSGCHVFTEKPIAKSVKRCKELINLAESLDKKLFVDLTWTFSRLVKSLGKQDNVEICLKRPLREGADDNDLWRLPPHALSIIDLMGAKNYKIDTNHRANERTSTIKLKDRVVNLDLDSEKDNLKYAVEAFKDVLTGKMPSNDKIMLEITKLLT